MWVMCMPAFAQEETLTVFDGTTEGTGTDLTIKTNDFVPAFTRKWNKAGTKSQIIIPGHQKPDHHPRPILDTNERR